MILWNRYMRCIFHRLGAFRVLSLLRAIFSRFCFASHNKNCSDKKTVYPLCFMAEYSEDNEKLAQRHLTLAKRARSARKPVDPIASMF